MNIEDYRTVGEVSEILHVQYFTLLNWIKKDVCQVKTDGLVVKKAGWLIHEKAAERLEKAIKEGEISSQS